MIKRLKNHHLFIRGRSCTQKNPTHTQTCNGWENLKSFVVYTKRQRWLMVQGLLVLATLEQLNKISLQCSYACTYIIHTLLDFSQIIHSIQHTWHICWFCSFQRHTLPLRSVGEPGSTGTKPLPPNTGRMNESSNFLHSRWTVWVGVESKARMLFGRCISWPSRSASESRGSPRSGTMTDFGVDDSVVVMLFVAFWWGSRSLISGLVSKPNTW
jgi:hypothetical protein